MFDELDDPRPDLRPSEVLPGVQARGRRLRRRRQLATAGGAGTAAALFVAAVVALPGSDSRTSELVPAAPPSSAVSSPPAPAPTPTPTTAPSAPVPTRTATTAPSAPRATPTAGPVGRVPGGGGPPPAPPSSASTSARPVLELRGDDLGATAVGAPRAQAVAAVTAVLGEPVADPAGDTACVSAASEVAWLGFRLAFDEQDRVSGWTSRDPGLATPSGVRAGTTVARLSEVYGQRLALHPPNPDSGDTYTVSGVEMIGTLSGPGPDDRVVALSNGACSGP